MCQPTKSKSFKKIINNSFKVEEDFLLYFYLDGWGTGARYTVKNKKQGGF